MKNKILPSGICRKHAISHTLYTHGFISPSFLFCSVKTLKLYLAPYRSNKGEHKSRRGAFIYFFSGKSPRVCTQAESKPKSRSQQQARNLQQYMGQVTCMCCRHVLAAWRRRARKHWGTWSPGQQHLAMKQGQGRISRAGGEV